MSTCNPTTDSKGRAWLSGLGELTDHAPLTLGQACQDVYRQLKDEMVFTPINFLDLQRLTSSNNLHSLLSWLARGNPTIQGETVYFCMHRSKYYVKFADHTYTYWRHQVHEIKEKK